MKLTSKALVLALTVSVFLASCGDGNSKNTLYFNNSSKADSEGYTFLKTVSQEVNYQQLGSSALSNSEVAQEVKTTYAEIATEMHALSSAQDVLTPTFATVDSVTVAELIKSQEVIVGQFKMVTHNTNVEIADYARKTLPKVEALLSKTKDLK